MLARPDISALLDRCERLAHQRGLTRHDLLAELRDWLPGSPSLLRLEGGALPPGVDLHALHAALDEYVDADDDQGGFITVGEVLRDLLPRIERRERLW